MCFFVARHKYMEWFLFEHPQWCIAALVGGNSTVGLPHGKFLSPNPRGVAEVLSHVPKRGSSTCGVDLHTCGTRPYYAGNFWFAKCAYVDGLPHIARSGNYDVSELWIGKGMSASSTQAKNRDGGNSVGKQFVSLFESKESSEWASAGIVHRSLYNLVFRRDYYAERGT